jgi:hypothetical protein
MDWRVFAGTATGKSHIDGGLPCQDALAHRVQRGLLVAVVCDGAGSQPLSHEGAQTVSRDVVAALAAALADDAALAALIHDGPQETHGIDAFTALAVAAVAGARATLEAMATAGGHALNVYSSTLVGVVAGANGGYFFHIGDGLGVAEPLAAAAPVLSLPENGEYANETYFVTGSEWRAHLRVLPFSGAVQRIALMSDGAASFVMAKGNAGLFKPFVEPVEKFLLGVADAAAADAALAATLADPRTHSITGDDKALLLALPA